MTTGERAPSSRAEVDVPSGPPDLGAAQATVASLAQRLTRLARVASELLRSETVEAVSRTVVTHGAEAVGASVATMTLLVDDQTVRLVAISGGLPGDEERWATFPLSARTVSADAIRTGRRVTVSGARALADRYPDMQMHIRNARTVVALPLTSGARALGAVGLLFSEDRTLDAAELEFLDILADSCAQSLDRIAAQQLAVAQTAKLTFLADAAAVLGSSLDHEATLASVARLAVPTFADWSAIDLVEDGRLRRLSVAHVDPAKERYAQELFDRYPPDPTAPNGTWHVIRTGRSQLIADVTDEMLVAGAVDEEHLAIARALDLRSVLTVPLVARDRVLGALSWVTAESERRYGAADLALAEEVAKRAAVAIDNAELHSQTLAAATELQHAVLPQALPSTPTWQLAHHYSPSGRTEVGGDFYDAIALEDGRLAFFVGDVMGRGVGAAAAMAQVKAAVRAYAALDPTPEVVLTRLDQMYDRFHTEQLVTLVYALIDPAHDCLEVANAGHPAPVVLQADGTTGCLPDADGAPLGVTPHQPRGHHRVLFCAGDAVLAFTDGLIERRDEDITTGHDRLQHAVGRFLTGDLDAGLQSIVRATRDPSRDDDVALLAVRRRG